MSLQALNGQPASVQRRSSLLQRYQPKESGSQDPLPTSPSNAPIVKSTSQRSLQNSSLLQRYQPRPLGGGQAGAGRGRPESQASFYSDAPAKPVASSSSQRSLDQSKLLRRYQHQPNSVEESTGTGREFGTHEPQRYSSQKSLEGSRLLQRYNPINNSQEFTGLSGRESTPVARFNRGASLEPERVQRSSLLAKYTPRFGKSLDRHALEPMGAGRGYAQSQQNLWQRPAEQEREQESSQSLAASRSEIADYGTDHFDQYTNVRSRSSSLSRGPGKGLLRGSQRQLPPLEPPEPVTPETLPVVGAITEPVLGNVASALPMPMVSVIPPTPAALEVSKQSAFEVTREPPKAVPVPSPAPSPAQAPVKPVRKDLLGAGGAAAASNSVSIAIPSITTTLAAPSVKQSVSSEPPKEPSPPLFSTRDRMDHYGSASNPEPSPILGRRGPASTATATATSTVSAATLALPLSDMSSRRSMNDLHRLGKLGGESRDSTLAAAGDLLDVDEFADRSEMRRIAGAQRPHPVKHTLASAFEQLAALTVPSVAGQVASTADADEDERIEALPPDRKLKKRDFTYHPSFVPKQGPAGAGGNASTASKAEVAEEKRQRAAEEKRVREEEKRRREQDKQARDQEEKRRREQEKLARDEEERRRREENARHKEEEKRAKEEEKHAREEEKRAREEEKRLEREEKKRAKEEKKKAKASPAKEASASMVPEEVKQPEEEMIDLASHLDHYSVAVTKQTQQQQQQLRGGRPRSGGTPYGSQGALGPAGPVRSLSASHQSLERNGSTASVRQSRLLQQRYGGGGGPKAGSQEVLSTGSNTGDTGGPGAKEFHRSQGSLDFRRSMRPSLLDKYTPRPLSASTATGGSQQPTAAASTTVRSSSQRSLDNSSLLQRYRVPKGSVPARTTAPGYDQYDHRDHEYEPIGEPTVDAGKEGGQLAAAQQERKPSAASFLRVPGDEGDTISMEELQRSIEDRYFNLPTDAPEAGAPSAEQQAAGEEAEAGAAGAGEAASGEKPNKMKAAMAKAQSSGKQAMARAQESGKQAMARAQEGGKTLQKKLLVQTDRLKTKMSNIKLKKDREQAPLASPEAVTTPELEQLDFTLAVPKDEQPKEVAEGEEVAQSVESTDETTTTAAGKGAKGKFGDKLKNIHMPKLQKPDFASRISKPKMPKLKAPEMPKFLTERPDFARMKPDFARMKLTRSKSMKEASPSGATSAASPSDASVVGDGAAPPSGKVNYTDFSTYPRLFDKFKRQKSTPSGQASVRAGTPPPLEFTKSGKGAPALASRWASDKSEDASEYIGGSELDERETSVERRMRQELERAEFEGPELALTEERRQLEDYDKENREIHLASAARHEEFLKRKPPMERQESDLASEEEKQFWASSLGQKIRQNIDMNSNDLDFLDEEERLMMAREDAAAAGEREEAHEQARQLLQLSRERSEKQLDRRRSSTPYTDKECQSSGSSSVRRRKGVLEEIDDDEFFLRQKGISKDNIQLGEYISSAIKEGLANPKNALADMGRYGYYDDEEDVEEEEERNRVGLSRYYQPSFESDDVSAHQDYRTFPPDRPNRRSRKGQQQDEFEAESARYMDDEQELEEDVAMLAGSVVPPTPPTRRRKRPNMANGKSISNSFIAEPPITSMTVNRVSEVPLAKEESFGTLPAPTPRRSRSRSQISKTLDDDDRVSRGAESLIVGIIDAPLASRESYPYEVSESTGYATVRKEPPPRPPAPTIRRRKSTRSLDAQPQPQARGNGYNTLPSYNHSVSPVRPQRNYSTINPNRPPRRKSVTSLTSADQSRRFTREETSSQYEDVITPAPPLGPKPPTTALQSGDVASKMKDRPLPPPPRPTRKPRRPDGSDGHDLDGGGERLAVEIETATQTSDEFGLDAEIAAVTERADRAELEGALSRFRDGNARALSDRPKSSRSGSRPETPASILIERKVSTPSLAHESIVEASLTVQPLEEYDDDQYIAELVKKYVSEERKPVGESQQQRKTEALERRLRKSTNSLTREDEAAAGGGSLRAPGSFRSSRSLAEGRQSAATPNPVEIAPNVIEEIVERLRTTEQHHLDELQKQHQAQLEDLRRQHEEQKRLQEQKLEEQQRQLLEQQSQQLLETQQLREQILQQQEHQKMLLAQQQNQQQQLLVAQQQQQLLMEQQEKERELQRDKERELLRERELELERARERERELHLARELELQRVREVEQQRARDLEQQRLREMELQRARELEHQRLRELEIQRAIEAEQARQRELELQQKAMAAAAVQQAAPVAPPAGDGATTQENGAAESVPKPTVDAPTEGASVDVVDGAAAAAASVATSVAGSAEQPPQRPPLPPMAAAPPFVYHPEYLSYAMPPGAASYLMRTTSPPSDEDPNAMPLAPHRRRRHHRSKRESTSEEDFQQREQRRHRHGTRSPEPSIPSLGGQLVRACGSSIRQTGDELMSMLRASSKDENKRDLHIAIIILIVIVAGLMALGMSGEKAVHHHHWDYFSPPGHGSSA